MKRVVLKWERLIQTLEHGVPLVVNSVIGDGSLYCAKQDESCPKDSKKCPTNTFLILPYSYLLVSVLRRRSN